MTELIECPICKKPIASSVKRCPGCGARLSKTQKFNARRVDADGNQVIPKSRRIVCKKCKTVYDMAEDRCPSCGEKNSSWKIGCLVILAVCVFIGFLFSKLPEPATDTATAEKSKAEISYKVEKTKGQQNFISISKEDVTEEKLELLGEKLKKKYSNPVQVFIFDDAEIAKAWPLENDNPEAEKHFVGLYWNAGKRHDFKIMLDGMNGKAKTIEYKKEVREEDELPPRYSRELPGIIVDMDGTAFIITNNSGSALTNLQLIINQNDSSRKQYTCKVERIDNNRKYSVGMLLFANSKNEVFNPFALKVASFSIYSDQGYAVFNTSY